MHGKVEKIEMDLMIGSPDNIQSKQASVDVFCVQASPDFSNKEIATWRSLDLIETLLYLADTGHQAQVQYFMFNQTNVKCTTELMRVSKTRQQTN